MKLKLAIFSVLAGLGASASADNAAVLGIFEKQTPFLPGPTQLLNRFR
jgi:hypothetical protein